MSVNKNSVENLNNNFLPEQYFLYLLDYFSLLDNSSDYNDVRNLIIKTQKYYIKKNKSKVNAPLYIFITKLFFLSLEINDNAVINKDKSLKFIMDKIDSYFEYKREIIKELL